MIYVNMGGKKIIELPEGYDIRDIEKLIKEDKQEKKVNQYRRALSLFIEIIKEIKHKVIITLDGRDTAGKGYTLKKMTEYLDTRVFNIVSFGTPTLEERKKMVGKIIHHIFFLKVRVSDELKIDLKPNKEVYRLGKDELTLMNKRGE